RVRYRCVNRSRCCVPPAASHISGATGKSMRSRKKLLFRKPRSRPDLRSPNFCGIFRALHPSSFEGPATDPRAVFFGLRRLEPADRLHLVDLDGARDGKAGNRDSIAAIVRAVDFPCQLGGGIRDEAAIRDRLSLGVARVVIGTQALKDPDWFRRMCNLFPGQL